MKKKKLLLSAVAASVICTNALNAAPQSFEITSQDQVESIANQLRSIAYSNTPPTNAEFYSAYCQTPNANSPTGRCAWPSHTDATLKIEGKEAKLALVGLESGWTPLYANIVNVKNATLQGLNFRFGDLIILKNGNDYFLMPSDIAKVSATRGIMNIDNSDANDVEFEGNKLNINTAADATRSTFKDVSIGVRELNINNVDFVTENYGIEIDALDSLKGSGNTVEVKKDGFAISGKLEQGKKISDIITQKESAQGLSNTKKAEITYFTKDGYTLWIVADKAFLDPQVQFQDLAKNATKDGKLENFNYSTWKFGWDNSDKDNPTWADEGLELDANGNLKMTSKSPFYKVFTENGILNTDGTVNMDKLNSSAINIEDIANKADNSPSFNIDLTEFAKDTEKLKNKINEISSIAYGRGISKLGLNNASLENLQKGKIKIYDFDNPNNLTVVASATDVVDIKSKDKITLSLANDPQYTQIYARDINVENAILENISLSAGDDMLLRFTNDKGEDEFIKLYVKKDNANGTINFKNAEFKNADIETNKFNTSSSIFTDADISSSQANVSNSKFIAKNENAYFTAIKGFTGTNNELIAHDGKMSVAAIKGGDANSFKAGVLEQGISKVAQNLEKYQTKDGYTVYKVSNGNITAEEGDIAGQYFLSLNNTNSQNNFIAPMIIFDELIGADGKIDKSKTDPKILKALRLGGILKEDGSIDIDNLYKAGMSLDTALNGNFPEYIAGSVNVPGLDQMVSTKAEDGKTSVALDFTGSVTDIKFKDTSDGVLMPGSNELKLHDEMYGADRKINIFYTDSKGNLNVGDDTVKTAKLNKINIFKTNISTNSKNLNQLIAKNSINISGSTIEGFDKITAGGFLEKGDKTFTAISDGKGIINIVNSAIKNSDIIANEVNINDVVLAGGVDRGVIFANNLNANNLNIIDGGAFIYGSAQGSNNTLTASVANINNADDSEPYSIAFVKGEGNNFFKVNSTKAGLSEITPASVMGVTQDGFKMYAIGSDKWLNSVKTKDGKLSLHALAIALGEGSFKGNDLVDNATGKLKTDTEFYKFLSTNNAIKDDGTINLAALGGIKDVEEKTITSADLANIASNTIAADGRSNINAKIDTEIKSSASDLAARSFNISKDIEVKSLKSAITNASSNGAFIDKTYGEISIEGAANKVTNVKANEIETNKLVANNTNINTQNLKVNTLKATNTTIDTSAGEAIVSIMNGADLKDVKFKVSKNDATIIMIKGLKGDFANPETIDNSVARAAANLASENIDSQLIKTDDGIIYINNASKASADSQAQKIVEATKLGVTNQDELILISKGILEASKDAEGNLELKLASSVTQEQKKEFMDANIINFDENGKIASVQNSSVVEALTEENQTIFKLGSTNANQKAINMAKATLNQAKFAYTLEVNNMTKRLGEIRDLDGNVGIWTRAYAGKGSYDNYQDIKFYSTTIGTDKYVDDDTLIGASFGYNQQKLSKGVDGKQKTYVGTLYASKIYNSGLFMDGVIKWLNTKGEYENNELGKLESKRKNAFLASAQVGYRYGLNNGFFVEPSAELITGYIPSNTLKNDVITLQSNSYMPLNTKVELNAGFKPNDKIVLRAGIGGMFELTDAKITLKDSFGTNVNSKSGKDSRGFANIFGAYKINQNTMINLEAERTFGGKFNVDYNFNFNLRYQF